ncbi:MAG TPA: penicillin acylase family protein [Candidatus Acidoferrum sp.]|nr:penicillin acylase family protein [Candidatus Acidoferrum sp.]
MNPPAVTRIVKYVNIAIAIVLLLSLALVYWYVWRVLPDRSGSISAAVNAPVTVAFDTHGEPHIRASNLEDALFVQGYVTAQDRLWQMDALRRFAGGTLAEIMGPQFLESDREARRQRMRRLAEEGYAALPDADRAAFAAYTRGVNYFMSTHLDKLPLEFTLLGYQPRPWSSVDCLLMCLYMYRSLTTTWKDELVKTNLLAQGNREKVQFLFPSQGTGDASPGSNAWVVGGRHTASGKPILSNDMHLEYSVPGIWYMTHLQAPGLDVAGVALPGAPGIIVGHNQRIAWGITNLHFDVQDLYLERYEDRSGRYLFNGQLEQSREEREVILVKGKPAVELTVRVTRHGPIFISEGDRRLSLKWSAAQPGFMQYPFLDINRAGNWNEFLGAIKRLSGPGSNFVYADIDGNIGYHAAGMLPRRKSYRGDVPVDGSSGIFEWDGYIPFEELPSVYNPPSGLIVTANQNPFPKDYPYPVNGNFAPPYRARQIRALLSAKEGWRAEDMLRVQGDIYSGFSDFLAKQVVAAYDHRNQRNPGLDPAVQLLRTWNGQMDKNLAAPLLITLVYQHVRRALAENASSATNTVYEFNLAPVAVERLLRERPAGWFDDYDQMLLRALVDGVEEAQRMQGRDLKRWRYGTYLLIPYTNPVIHQIPLVGHYFDIGPVSMSGSNYTPKQSSLTLSPSMRMSADLGDWERSLLNITVGQSGQILSSHYRDQWDDYYHVRSYPMQFGKVQATSTLEFRP